MGVLQHTVLGCCGVYNTVRVQLLHILLSVSAVVTPLNFPDRFGVLKAHPNFNSVDTQHWIIILSYWRNGSAAVVYKRLVGLLSGKWKAVHLGVGYYFVFLIRSGSVIPAMY